MTLSLMLDRPPQGIRPPQFEGKRSGRPKGSRDHAAAWADVRWGDDHRAEDYSDAIPSPAARLWWHFAHHYPDVLAEFLARYCR